MTLEQGSWLTVVVICAIAVVLLAVGGYTGYSIVVGAVGLAAAVNLLPPPWSSPSGRLRRSSSGSRTEPSGSTWISTSALRSLGLDRVAQLVGERVGPLQGRAGAELDVHVDVAAPARGRARSLW